MNRKVQFFIISSVVISIALTVVVALFSVPTLISTKVLISQSRDMLSLNSFLLGIESISSHIHSFWRTGTNRIAISAQYSRDSLLNVLYLPSIDEIDPCSASVIDDSGKKVGAYASYNAGDGVYLSLFGRSVEGEDRFYLVHDKPDGPYTPSSTADASYLFNSTGFFYSSPFYTLFINGSNGVVEYISLIGGSEVINYMGANSNSNSQTTMDANLTIISNSSDVVVLNVSGMIDPSVALQQVYTITPRAIFVTQKFDILSSGTYNLSYYVSSSLDSIYFNGETFSPLSQPTELLSNITTSSYLFESNSTVALFNTPSSYAFIKSTLLGVDERIQLRENSFSLETVYQTIAIVPELKRYDDLYSDSYIISYSPSLSIDDYLNNSYNFITSPISAYGYETNMTYSLGEGDVAFVYSSTPSNIPVYIPFSLEGRNGTVCVSDENKYVLSGLTSSNWRNSSYIPFYFKNDVLNGIGSTNFSLINLDGDDFTIGIESIGGIPNSKLYYPNGTVYSFSSNYVNINSMGLSGEYTLSVEGDVNFKVNSSLPLINVNGPFIINSTSTSYLYFEANKDFGISATGIGSDTWIVLNSTRNIIINSSIPLSYTTIKHNFTWYSPYSLIVGPGVVLINSSNVFGIRSNYLRDDDLVYLVVNEPIFGLTKFKLNYPCYRSFNTDISYSQTTSTVSNTYFDWDLDDDIFTYSSSSNWFYGEPFYSCIGTYGSCDIESTLFDFDSLIDNTTISKAAYFDSTSIGVVAEFYNNSNLIKLTLINPTDKPFVFGFNFKADGTDDTLFKTSSTEEKTIAPVEEYLASYDIGDGRWAYMGKSDGTNYVGIIFNYNDILNGDKSIIYSNSSLKLYFNRYGDKTIYLYIGKSWDDFSSVVSSLNSLSQPSNKLYIFNYDFNSNNVESSGVILG